MTQVIFDAELANLKSVPSRSVRQIILETDRGSIPRGSRHALDDLLESGKRVRVLIIPVSESQALADFAAEAETRAEEMTRAEVSEGMPWQMYTREPFQALVVEAYSAEFDGWPWETTTDPKVVREAYLKLRGVTSTKELSQAVIKADMDQAAARWAARGRR